MAREKEILLLGGSNRVVHSDALEGFSNSPEVGVQMRIRTKRHSPFAPAGEGVGRRMYVQVQHKNGVAFDATPVGNGRRRRAMRKFFQRPPKAGDPARVSFLVPTSEEANDGAFAVGLRATTFGLEIVSRMPRSEFFLESFQVEAYPLQASRGRTEGDT